MRDKCNNFGEISNLVQIRKKAKNLVGFKKKIGQINISLLYATIYGNFVTMNHTFSDDYQVVWINLTFLGKLLIQTYTLKL